MEARERVQPPIKRLQAPIQQLLVKIAKLKGLKKCKCDYYSNSDDSNCS
jgi:hypothetical protein